MLNDLLLQTLASPWRAESALTDRGATVILGARYIPVGRVAVNKSAGALRFPWQRFALLSVIAGISWSVLSIAIGVFAAARSAERPLVGALIGIVIAIGVGLVVDRLTNIRRRRVASMQVAG